MSKFTTPAILLAALLAAGAANAGESMRIVYGDLDLATADGAATFDRRLEATAQHWCRREPRSVHTIIRNRAACVDSVRAEAVEQLPRNTRRAWAAALKEHRGILLAQAGGTARR